MNPKALLCGSVAAIALFSVTPAAAQTTTADPVVKTKSAKDKTAPQPVADSADGVSPAAPQAAIQDAPADGEIVVTGLRRSLQSAQAIKKNSDAIVDVVVAEDIGKLPDTFASSALQRVAGVAVTRGGGESAGVTVRGLPDLTTTYNGRQIFTAEGRYVQIQDFPAGTVAALEVFKSGTANQIEGGIAGSVNVRGRKPFDFKGFEVSGSLNGVYSEQANQGTWNGNLLVSNRWNTGIGEMGLLVNVSYVGIRFLDSTREQSLVIGTTNAGNAPGVQAGLRFPDAQGNFLGYGNRNRPSANAAFQWKPTPELEIYADGLFQGFRSKDYNRWQFNPIFGAINLSNVTVIPGTNQISSALVRNAVRPDGYTGSFNGKTDTYQAGGGAIWKRDRMQISADVAYTDSTFTADLVNVDYAFASSPDRNVSFEVSPDGGPAQTYLNFDLTNPANFISRGLYQEYTKVNGKSLQARTDLSYDLNAGFLKRIQMGVRYENRDAGRDFGNIYRNNEGDRVPLASLPGAVVKTGIPGFVFNNAQPTQNWAAITRDSIRANLPALRSFFGQPAGRVGFNPFENFRANEKSYAAYAQVKYGFDLGSTTVDGLVGLRAVKTKTNVSGFASIANVFGPITAKNEYTDYLPNVSSRFAFSNKLQLRLAYTKTRTRPNFFDLRPTLTLGQPVILAPGDSCANDTTSAVCVERRRRGGFGGNPNLKPLTSNNYDASLEWYFSRTGSLTGAIFRHDAKGFISGIDNRYTDPIFGPVRINQPVNTGKTRLQGAEVQFTSFLDIESLPSWAKGFGIQANATYIDAKGDLPADLARSFNNEQQRFNGVSKFAYNLIALYERPRFSARLAYNYRSKFAQFYSYQPLDPIAHPVVEKGRGQLDFATSYTPVPSVTIALDVVNIMGNPLQRYRQYDTGDAYTRQVIYLERSYSLGARFRF